jgi:hypothetical protein
MGKIVSPENRSVRKIMFLMLAKNQTRHQLELPVNARRFIWNEIEMD